MLSRLRQILLTQYIGAIVTGLVAAQCVQTLIRLITSFVWQLVATWHTPTSLLGESRYKGADWSTTIYNLIEFLLNIAVVYGLLRWLYFGHQAGAIQVGTEHKPPAPETPPLNA